MNKFFRLLFLAFAIILPTGAMAETAPDNLYIIGNLNDASDWSYSGTPLTKSGNTFTGTGLNFTTVGGNDVSYFAVTSKNDNWENVNNNRWGGSSITVGSPAGMSKNNNGSWTVTPGTYDVTVDFTTMQITLTASQGGGGGGGGDIHDPKDWIVNGIPVIYIDVYNYTYDANGKEMKDENKNFIVDTSSLNNEILDINLPHKNYFLAKYRLESNNSQFKSVGTAEAPLTTEIKARGNFTRTGYAKKPFKLKLEKKQDLLGLNQNGQKSKHFALIAHPDDEFGFLRNFTGFELGRRIGLPWSPGQQPVQVVINGDYRGLYFLTESIRVGDGRIPIEELEDEETNPALLSGGYLVEFDNYADDAVITLQPQGSTGSEPLYITPDTPEKYSDTQLRFIREQFTTMNNLVGQNSNDLWKYLDLDDAARYYIVEELIGHWESYHGSTYLFRDRYRAADAAAGTAEEIGKWHFSPLWDCGHAFDISTTTSIIDAAQYGQIWVKGLWSNQKFKDKVSETWKWFMQKNYGNIIDLVKQHSDLIGEAAKKDYERWKGIKPSRGNATGDYRYVVDNSNIADKTQKVVDFLSARIDWLNSSRFGNYNDGIDHQEPARDNTPAASLPDYVLPGYVPPVEPVYTVYYKGGDSAPRIWIWDGDTNYTGGDWNSRPTMSTAKDASGDTYYYYTFKTSDSLQNPYVKFNEEANCVFINGALYGPSGKISDDYDPDYVPQPVEIYVYNDAGWGQVNMWLWRTENGKDVNHSTSWPGEKMEKDDNLTVKASGTSYTGLYHFTVPANFSTGNVIFSNNGNDQYPEKDNGGLSIGGKEHIFIISSKTWVEVDIEPEPEPSGTIPVVSITTEGSAEISRDAKVNFTLSIDPKESGFSTITAVTGTIKGRGSSSWTDFNKKPYKIEFDKKQAPCGMNTSKHWVLLPFASDQETGYIRNPLGHYLARTLDTRWHPAMQGVELVVNGKYLGLYFLAENIRPAAARVQIVDYKDAGYSPENDWILEIDNEADPQEAIHSWQCENNADHYVVASNPEKDDFTKVVNNNPDVTVEQLTAWAKSHSELLQQTIETAGSEDVTNPAVPGTGGWDKSWMETIDAESAVNFYLIQEIMDDVNAYNTNLYLHHTTGSKWFFGPVWNFESAFHSLDSKNQRIYDVPGIHQTWARQLYYNRYFRVMAIRTLDKWAGITETSAQGNNAVQPGSALSSIDSFIDEYYATYAEAIKADARRWPEGSLRTAPAAVMAAAEETAEPDVEAMKSNVKSYVSSNLNYLLNSGRDVYGGVTGIDGIETDTADAPAEYFDLQGIRINAPISGQLYIVRRGTNVTKEIYR